jgi:Putative glucoamylase/Protein of unknown function (DUF3131)
MTWRRLSALLILLTCPSVARAGSYDLRPADRAALSGYARDTWRSFDALAQPSGLPADMLSKTADGWSTANYTSPSDVAAYLWSTLAAEDLKIIGHDEATARMGRTLATLEKLERSHGFFYNWYDPRDGSTLKSWPGGGPVRPFLSTVDNGWLAASLMMVRNARPQFRAVADHLLASMNFGFFYDPYDATNPGAHPGLLRGGFYADDNTFAGFHYGMLNTEARIASYVGIAQGHLPLEHYYRMSRARPPDGDGRMPTGRGEVREYHGVPVDEGFRTYRGLRVVPSWDGSMFEALMVALFVPEAEWAPHGWGVNHPLYVRASIENATQDVRLPAWGASPSSIPGGGYRVYGVTPLSVDGRKAESTGDTVMTPHASFLALPFAPREALDNMEVLASRFKAYGPHGFLDAVDVSNGRLAECELAIDQGMIIASVANALGEGMLQRAFCEGKVADVIKPLIAPERFGSGIETRETRTSSAREVPGWKGPRSAREVEPKFRWESVGASPIFTSLKEFVPLRRIVNRSLGDFALSD